MQTEIVKRTKCTCDFCGKQNWSKGHMRRHEERCTMNPNRRCGVCRELLEQDQPDINVLVAMVPLSAKTECEDEFGVSVTYDSQALNAALPGIFEAAGGCPNCTAAAFRQAGMCLRAVDKFRWGVELKAIWSDVNQAQLRQEVF